MRIRIVAVVLALGALLCSSASPARSVAHDPRYGAQHGTSTHWSGYAVAGTGATDVIGTWTEPAVACAPGETSWSSAWVGIDGDVSNTVEQIGSDSNCLKGTPVYDVWYEMYPKSPVILPITVSPGDSLTGEVTYGSGTFTLTLTDTTTNVAFQTTQQSKKAQLTSVEWIVEGLSNKPLSDFGSVSFTGASATIDGQTGGVGSFASAEAITMVTSQGVSRAVPSRVTGKKSFDVSWQWQSP
jgi:hypothetical protein